MGKILVTGARGYLGGRLVQHLVSLGNNVIGSTRGEPIRPDGWPDQTPLITLGILADLNMSKKLEGVDCIYHLSAPNAQSALRDPDIALFETATGTRRLIEAAILAGVKKFVFLSTMQVYGNMSGEISEDTLPKPPNPYAIAHLAGEHFALAASNRINVIIVRLSNGTGTPAWLDSNCWMLAGTDFARQAVYNGEIVVNSPGQWRDFLALADVCKALEILSKKEVASGIVNLSSGKAMKIGDLAAITASTASKLLEKQVSVRAPTVEDSAPSFHISYDKFGLLGFVPSGSVALELEQANTIKMLMSKK